MANWGAAGKGAVGGAATGAAVGSIIPGYGTAIGAAAGGIIGGLGGLFSGDDSGPDINNPHAAWAGNQLQGIAGSAQDRFAPQIGAAYLDRQYLDQSRGGLMGTANRLGSIASGQQLGAGEMAVNRQVGQVTAAQLGAARMARGANSALAYRNAMRNTSDIGLAGAGQAAQAQLQDQASANAQLGQIYGSMYGQDANIAGQNAQLAQQANLANQGAQLTQQQMNDSRQITALGQLLGWDQSKINAELQKAALPIRPDSTSLLMQGAGQAAIAMSNNYNRQQPVAATPPAAAPAYNGSGPVINRLSDF